MSSNPWQDLPPSRDAMALTGVRVAGLGRWDFFWARDVQGRYVWAMDLHSLPSPDVPLPNLRGVDVQNIGFTADSNGHLILTLLDSSAIDLFMHLCTDVMESTSDANDETDAAARALARTWRWHHLLRGAGPGLLTAEEQQGLIGELFVLESLVEKALGLRWAIKGWTGPMGSPKDFELSSCAIEVKTRRGMSTPFIAISSEHQLDDRSCDRLYIAVVEVQESSDETSSDSTLSDVASRIQHQVEGACPDMLATFESRLAATGFRWEDDYSDFRWLFSGAELYQVGKGFPRIIANDLSPGLTNVSYTLSLNAINDYKLNIEKVISQIRQVVD